MWKVIFEDQKMESHTYETSDRDGARAYYYACVKDAVRGLYTAVILVDPEGNYVENWGT